MTIYQAMVAVDGVRSYLYVRADNISQAFDCALMRANARSPQSDVEVIAAQELREPVDVYISRPVEVFLTPISDPHGVSQPPPTFHIALHAVFRRGEGQVWKTELENRNSGLRNITMHHK